jgi:hypothetical protein
MGRIEVMKDLDNYTETEDELVSLLHLNKRMGLNRLMQDLSTDYKSALDYICNYIIPETANTITGNNEDEREEDANKLQSASLVASPKRQAAVTSNITVGEDTRGRCQEEANKV